MSKVIHDDHLGHFQENLLLSRFPSISDILVTRLLLVKYSARTLYKTN